MTCLGVTPGIPLWHISGGNDITVPGTMPAFGHTRLPSASAPGKVVVITPYG